MRSEPTHRCDAGQAINIGQCRIESGVVVARSRFNQQITNRLDVRAEKPSRFDSKASLPINR